MKKIFKYSEIITIVMEKVNSIEQRELYNIVNDIMDFPQNIKNKISMLNSNEYMEFCNHIDNIAENIFEIKSGELNELNNCYDEIIRSIDKEWLCE